MAVDQIVAGKGDIVDHGYCGKGRTEGGRGGEEEEGGEEGGSQGGR